MVIFSSEVVDLDSAVIIFNVAFVTFNVCCVGFISFVVMFIVVPITFVVVVSVSRLVSVLAVPAIFVVVVVSSGLSVNGLDNKRKGFVVSLDNDMLKFSCTIAAAFVDVWFCVSSTVWDALVDGLDETINIGVDPR